MDPRPGRPRRALITGAGIAGPALAHWLGRYGWETVVVERATGVRAGGQNIDVRGAGREVTRRMGLEQAVHDATTGEVGTRFVTADGVTVAEFPAGTSQSGGTTAEVEILREDLANLLVARTRDRTDYVFDDRVVGVRDEGGHVRVALERGAEREVDVVVAADGLHSSTRSLVFGPTATVTPLGLQMAWLTIDRIDTDDQWWRWFNAPGGRVVTLRPDNVGTTRAALSFRDAPAGAEHLPREQQRQLLVDVFAGAGWQAERVLDGVRHSPDFYLEAVAQVHVRQWSRGRVALLGDAAFAPSPVSGMGTSLALVGAYVLAGELASHVHHVDAFRGYERIMRPYVEQAQKLPPGVPWIAHPRTGAGIAALRTALRLASSRVVRRAGDLYSPPADRIDLPGYAHLVA
jgi:2-polyprenyl-6-methoxyphenol hydroxylase-like FAD-dependent oxidoreductase